MKKIFKKPSNFKLKIFSAICSAFVVLPTICTPIYADYNELMRRLNNSTSPITAKQVAEYVTSMPKEDAAKILKETCRGKTILYYVLCTGNNTYKNRCQIATLLIDLGVPLNIMRQGVRGEQAHPYIWACEHEEFEFASWMLRQPSARFITSRDTDLDFHTLSDWARWYGRADDWEYIYKNFERLHTYEDMNVVNIEAEKKEIVRSYQSRQKMCQKIKQTEADTSWRDKHTGNSRLHEAIQNGDEARVRELLTIDSLLNAKNKYGSTPLHIATIHNNFSIVKLLVEKGADVNATDNAKHTPLDVCCDKKIHDLLKEKGGTQNRGIVMRMAQKILMHL